MNEERLGGLLDRLIREGGSDLHLRVGRRPWTRIDGELRESNGDPLDLTDLESLEKLVRARAGRQGLPCEKESDFSFSMAGVRLRVNLFRERQSPALVFRLIPQRALDLSQLGLPEVVEALTRRPSGLVLVTGPSGAGKTTTLAAMVEAINRDRHRHILTIEDPVEFLHKDDHSLITQREIHTDTDSFPSALRSALREDPDVILVGEMRDPETVDAALQLAETGHLTLSTAHTNSACSTLNRIVSSFRGARQGQIRAQLSLLLQGIVCQQLLPRKERGGRVVAAEILVVTPAIRHLIRENKTHQIYSHMQSGKGEGMLTMNESLASLFLSGQVALSDCLSCSPDTREFQELVVTRTSRPRPVESTR